MHLSAFILISKWTIMTLFCYDCHEIFMFRIIYIIGLLVEILKLFYDFPKMFKLIYAFGMNFFGKIYQIAFISLKHAILQIACINN